MSPNQSVAVSCLLLSLLFLFCLSQVPKQDIRQYRNHDKDFPDWKHHQDRAPRYLEPSVKTTFIHHPYEALYLGNSLEEVTTYSVLKSDPKSSLTSSFTICSVAQNVDSLGLIIPFILLGDDGSHFIAPDITSNPENTRESTFTLGFSKTFHKPSYNGIPMVFQSQWVRVCLAVNIESGRIQFVVNGHIVEDMVYQVVADSAENRPTNLTGRIVLGAVWWNGWWYNSAAKTTNLNVFSSSLSIERMQSMTKAGGDECGARGDYLSWEEMEWSLHGLATLDYMEEEQLCGEEPTLMFYVAGFRSMEQCMKHCQKLGGRAPPVRTEEEWRVVEEFLVRTEAKIGFYLSYIWLPITDADKEGNWTDYYTGELLNYTLPFTGAGSNAGKEENCAATYTANLWKDVKCDDSTISCMCSHTERPILYFRGLCNQSNINRLYLLTNINDDVWTINIKMIGVDSTSIFNNYRQWVIYNSEHNTTGISSSPLESYNLGSHTWYIEGDRAGCGRETYYTIVLKLTTCKDGEFTCKDGQCVLMEQRCDHVFNCEDKSDEKKCQMLILDESYNKEIPPITTFSTTNFSVVPAPVNISISLLKIVSMEEVNHIIELQFSIKLEWREHRAVYHNLKKDVSLNALPYKDYSLLWLPYVIYRNTDMKEAVKLNEDEVKTTVTVTREGNFTRSDPEVVDEIEIFQGKDNLLTMSQTYTKKFQCEYQLARYPFDTQKCGIEMVVQELDEKTVELVPDMMMMKERTELTMFLITQWDLVYIDKESHMTGIKMEITLKRRIANEMMTTFLPSVLLIVIVFITTFFHSFYFEAVVSVNLTVMLVMTTIFTATMDKLPSTAYIKMIDLWLLFGQLVPFVEVLLVTMMERYRERDSNGNRVINHHGRERKVSVSPAPDTVSTNCNVRKVSVVPAPDISVESNVSPVEVSPQVVTQPCTESPTFPEEIIDDNDIKAIRVLRYIEKIILPIVVTVISLLYIGISGMFYYEVI